MASNVRLQPFDTCTPEGRAKERIRRAALTAITAATARTISMATPIVTIPIILNYLGHDIYGLWVTATSFIGMFAFADLGLGNGLLTALSRASATEDNSTQQRLVSTTAFLLAGIALLLGAVLFGAFRFLPWATILNAKTSEAAANAAGVVAAVSVCFLANLPLCTVQRTQLALQQGYNSNLWQCLGSLCGMAVLVLGVKAKLAPAWLVLAISGVPVIITAANWCWFFYWAHPSLKPTPWQVSRESSTALLRVGLAFLAMSVLMTIGMYADNFIIAHVCGLRAVTIYSVPARISLILGAVINMICAPMWVANGEAFARGDAAWVRKNTRRLTKLCVVAMAPPGILATLLGPPFLRLWLGADFEVSRWLIGALTVSMTLVSAAAPYFMVLNGANIIAPQVKLFLVFTPVAVLLKILLAAWFGPTGVPFAQAMCYGLIILPAVVVLSRRAFREARVTQ